MKYGAFYLTISGVVEVWYTRLLEERIRNWPDFNKTFFEHYARSRGRRTDTASSGHYRKGGPNSPKWRIGYKLSLLKGCAKQRAYKL